LTSPDAAGEAAQPAAREEEEKQGFVEFLKELPILVVVAFAIALLIKTFLFQAFYIPSGSMENTLLPNDRVLVSKLDYRFGDPRNGQIVVFAGPDAVTPIDRGPLRNFLRSIAVAVGLASSEQDFIKRVIAIEGQTLEIRDGAVHVNGKTVKEPYLHDEAPISCSGRFCGPIKLGKDEVFVMGDNRANSRDSRVFGPIKESTIVGRARVLIWPPGRFETI
jgi:signal peptidase I